MTDRTIKVLGYGYGNIQTTIVATVSGNVVYSGNVTMVAESSDGPVVNLSTPDLFSFTVPVECTETLPISIEVGSNSSPLVVGAVLGNYGPDHIRTDLTKEQLAAVESAVTRSDTLKVKMELATPPLTEDEINTLTDDTVEYFPTKNEIEMQHNMIVTVGSGPDKFISLVKQISNQTIDTKTVAAGLSYNVPSSSTFSFDLLLYRGFE